MIPGAKDSLRRPRPCTHHTKSPLSGQMLQNIAKNQATQNSLTAFLFSFNIHVHLVIDIWQEIDAIFSSQNIMALMVMHGPKFLLIVGKCTELIPTMELLDLSSSPVFSFTHTARLLDPGPQTPKFIILLGLFDSGVSWRIPSYGVFKRGRY